MSSYLFSREPINPPKHVSPAFILYLHQANDLFGIFSLCAFSIFYKKEGGLFGYFIEI